MTKQQILQLIKSYQKEESDSEDSFFDKNDIERFTKEYEDKLLFSCEEIETEFDQTMIALISGEIKLGKETQYITITFKWDVVDIEQQEYDPEELIITFKKLHDKAKKIREKMPETIKLFP